MVQVTLGAGWHETVTGGADDYATGLAGVPTGGGGEQDRTWKVHKQCVIQNSMWIVGLGIPKPVAEPR